MAGERYGTREEAVTLEPAERRKIVMDLTVKR